MLFSVVVVLAIALFGSCSAQSSTTASSARSASSTTSSTAAVGATHTCSVGADGFNFTPNQINAEIGDVIEFRFYPQNHSVARAGFKNPCIPYEDTGIALEGFWSGFKPVAVVLSDPPIFRLPINVTEPVFFYCSAPGACVQGMIGVINPNTTFTFDTQLAFALNTTTEFSPLQYFPVEAAPTRTTTATGGTFIPSPSSSAPTSSIAPAAAASAGHSSSLSSGAIAGIAIGGAAVLVLAGALIYMCGRQKSLGDMLRHSQQPPPHPGHNSYLSTTPGPMSEANYPNMQKIGHRSVMSGQYSDQGYPGPATETESYRSMSPPIDERTGMMSVMANSLHAAHLRNGHPSPGTPGSGAFPSLGGSTYNSTGTHEIDQSDGVVRPRQQRDDTGPHELSGAGPSPDANSPRPFPFTDSESGYRPTDQKIDDLVH